MRLDGFGFCYVLDIVGGYPFYTYNTQKAQTAAVPMSHSGGCRVTVLGRGGLMVVWFVDGTFSRYALG